MAERTAEEREPRGVHNPRVIDLITPDAATGEVVLVMIEDRPWQSDPEQLRQLEAKFNAYLEYALGGHLAKQYAEYAERPVRFAPARGRATIRTASSCTSAPRDGPSPIALWRAGVSDRTVRRASAPLKPSAESVRRRESPMEKTALSAAESSAESNRRPARVASSRALTRAGRRRPRTLAHQAFARR